jgi:hypothetical protein
MWTDEFDPNNKQNIRKSSDEDIVRRFGSHISEVEFSGKPIRKSL